jgi:hypothetical protein
MTENTALWDKLGKTDPAHTKGFTRGGGFKGTAIKPMWSYRRMTEEFGPIGQGWGVNSPSFQVVPGTDGETLVFCTVSIWYEKPEQTSWGVGGDKVIAKFSSGHKSDDEAFKKAFTDAITNALKMIGMGADVHMGMFDDSKYVNTIAKEFEAEKAGVKADPKPISAAEQKRQLAAIDQDLLDCESILAVNTCAKTWASIMERDGWSRDYREAARPKFQARRDQLQASEDTTAAIQEHFPGATVVSDAEATRHPLNA